MKPQYKDENHDPIDQSRRKGIFHNAGFRVGIVCGLVIGILHLVIVIIINRPFSPEIIILWPIKLIVFYLGGYKAAQIQYENQRESVDALGGVQSAGSGAGLVTSLISWFFIFLGAFICDTMGQQVIVEPISLCMGIFLDVALAIGLGSLGEKRVVNRYKVFDV